MEKNKKRPRRPTAMSQWNQIEFGRKLETSLDLEPTNWHRLSRIDARDRILMLLSLQQWMTKPVEFFTS